MTTKCLAVVIVATMSLGACTQRTPEEQLIHDAGETLGGADNIFETATLLLEGKGTQYRLGQNMTVDGDLPYWEVDEYRREIDLTDQRWRVTQKRTSTFLTGNPVLRQEQISGVDGDVAYEVSGDGTVSRLAAQVAADRMAEHFHHPATLIRLAMTEGSTLGNMRQADGQDAIDITSASGKTYTMYVSPETRYPTRIESMGYDANLGDVTLATAFDDYWETGGLGGFQARLTMPREITTTLDDFTTWHLRVTTSVDQELPDVGAPEAARSAQAPEFQANVQVEEVTDGVWHLTGQSHHSVLVEFDDFLPLVEAPQNEARTLAAIAQARAIQPDKPLQYVVNTHHHFDHSGGIREVYGLSNGRRTMRVGLVARVRDDREPFGHRGSARDAHASAILMAHLPRERLLIVADAFSPNAQGAPFAPNLLEAVNDLEWGVDRIVPIRGPVIEFAALEEAAQKELMSR